MDQIKVLPKRHKTNHPGIFFKQVVKMTSRTKKEVDKIYVIQYKDIDSKWKIKTIGRHSEGIRIKDCIRQRMQLSIISEEIPVQENSLIFKEITYKYLNHIRLKLKDYKNIKGRIKNHINPSLGDLKINEIEEDHILFIQDNMRKTHAPNTINHVIEDIARIYTYFRKKMKMDISNPTLEISKLKTSIRERYLDVDEVRTLIESIKKDKILKIFVMLSLSTGGRVNTIFNIKRMDINTESSTINLFDFKNESQYIGFITSSYKEEILSYIKNLDKNDFVIHEDDRNYIQKELQKHLDTLFNHGVSKDDRKNRVVPHTLRHSFASNLAIQGTPIFTIQKLMNHKNINMTLRYAKLSPENGLKEVQKLY